MDCQDENIIQLILRQNQKADYNAVSCLMKCQTPAKTVLKKNHLKDDDEGRSIFHHAIAEFFMQVRIGKFALTGEAKICTYLIEITRRKWLAISKKNKKREFFEVPDYQRDNHGLREKVQTALLQLSASDRDILIAFYFYNQSLEDYAIIKNISYTAAKKRVSRARDRIKEVLKPKVQ